MTSPTRDVSSPADDRGVEDPVSPFPRSPSRRRRHQAAHAVAVTVGGVALLVTLNYCLYRPLPAVWILVAFGVMVILHETGHLVAGWARGFVFVQATFGPVTVTRRGLQWRPVPVVASVFMHPPHGGGRVTDWQWFYAGAVLFTAACLVLDLLVQGYVAGAPQVFLKILAAVFAYSLLINLWPAGTGRSDGSMLWRLRRRSPERAQNLMLLQIMTTPDDHLPEGGWTDRHVAILAQPSQDPSTELMLAGYRLVYRAWHRQDMEAELGRLEAVRSELDHRTSRVTADALLAFGWALRGHGTRAASYLALAETAGLRSRDLHLLHRAQLAVALAEHRLDDVATIAAQARQASPTPFDLAWIDRLAQEEEQDRPAHGDLTKPLPDTA